ncbi:MAG: hypothetical protein LBN24_05140 [Mediterranea sp.]|jgi:outer membrane lipoprotein-sorting protein|nr:hypothetical protein [Mediterranea sp.]
MKTVKTLIMMFSLTLAVSVSAQEAKYGFKSGIIKKTSIAMGRKLEGTTYVDNYGKQEAMEITIKDVYGKGMDQMMRTITDSTGITAINLTLNMGTRMKKPPIEPINYLQLTPEVRDKYKIVDKGEETIAGKPCQKYSLEINQNGQNLQTNTWIWEGFPLKIEISSNGMLLSTETATDIQTDVPIPAEEFLVPERAIITDK